MQHNSTKSNNSEILFGKIYATYLHKVQFFANSYLHDFDLAKNVAHDVFVSFWEKWDDIDFEREILPYLLTLTKNKCLNILRKDKVAKKFQDFSKINYNKEFLDYIALKDSSATRLYSNEVETILSLTMNEMPDKVREAFYLSRFNNMKYEEIANMLGVSVKTIENRIMSALKILRVNFKDYLPQLIGFLFLIL